MRRLLQLLTIVAVLFCALHIGEDAYAFEPAGTLGVEQGSTHENHDGADAALHAIHHHCPVTADLCGAPDFAGIEPTAGLVFPRPAAALRSLAQAPPVEPPLA